MFANYFHTDRLKARGSVWSPRKPEAEVLHGTFQGHFVAISVRVRGSQYIWHPSPVPGESWWAPYPIGKIRLQPSRRVRKAAKMALRRWLA